MSENIMLVVGVGIVSLLIGFLVSYIINSRKLNNSNEQIAVLNNSLTSIESSKTEVDHQLLSANQHLQELKIVQAEQETTLELLRAESDKKETLNAELTQQCKQLNNELTQTKELLSTVRAQYEAEVQKFNRLQQSHQQTQEELMASRTEVNDEKSANAALDKLAKGLEVDANKTQNSYVEVKQQIVGIQEKYEQLQERYTTLSSEHAELRTALDERDNSHKEKVAQLEENKQALSKEFENLANKIFEEKGKTFTDTSKASIDTMLQPFREQIDGFQKRINDVHDASLQGNTHLNAEIKKVLEIGLKMSDEATNLTSALKGDSQQRGAWGEVQLERTLEMSGLMVDAHYEKQSAFKDAEGKNKQTDYLIKLPGDKHIIIDSKVSLLAYERAVSAQTDEEYTLAMTEHANAVKSHINDLSSKDYTNLIGMRSPSFVLMFMPIEPAYIEALKHQKDLFSYGYDKGIVLVSHTTLIPILRTVANLWVMEQSNKEAREISDRAGEIYNNVCTLAERLSKLGNTMNTASKQYNDAVTSLVGQQGLHGKVERFTQLSSKISKTMPALEPKHMDFETEKLTLVAEPVEEGSVKQESLNDELPKSSQTALLDKDSEL